MQWGGGAEGPVWGVLKDQFGVRQSLEQVQQEPTHVKLPETESRVADDSHGEEGGAQGVPVKWGQSLHF